MNKTPIGWYKWYARDFLTSSKVRRMSITAQGVYRTLLDLQWEDSLVPDTEDEAKRIIGATDREWAEFQPFFSLCFPGGRNAKLDAERQEANSHIERKRAGGKRSAQLKAEAKSKILASDSQDSFNQTETETETKTEGETFPPPPLRPSATMVCEYMTSRGFPDPSYEAARFIAHYDSIGWKKGNQSITDWKACVATFELVLRSDGKWGHSDPVDRPERTQTEPIEGIDFRVSDLRGEVDLVTGEPFDRAAWIVRNGVRNG